MGSGGVSVGGTGVGVAVGGAITTAVEVGGTGVAVALGGGSGLGYGIADNDDLYSVDLSTNNRTLLGDISGISSSNDNVSGMSFDSAGNMWVYDREDGELQRVDFTTDPSEPTVVQTVNVGLTSGSSSYEELAIVPAQDP